MDLSIRTREDLLVTALEGGSNYWYQLDFVKPEIEGIKEGEPTSIRIFEAAMIGREFPVFDAETGEKLGEISLERMSEGEMTMKEKSPEFYHQARGDDWDAETADVWFQYVVMNEIVFG